MTDEIPERIREEARRLAGGWAWYAGKEKPIDQIVRALLAAERRGRASMREEAARVAEETKIIVGASTGQPHGINLRKVWCQKAADAIRALPLPGAAPHAALGLERTKLEREPGKETKP